MKVTKSQFYLIQLVVLVGVLGIAAAVVYAVVNYALEAEELARDTEQRLQVDRMFTTGEVYHSRMGEWSGVCDSIGVTDEVSCTEAWDGFSLEIMLPGGQFYCRDSEGFVGVHAGTRGSATTCQ